jgi:hypothetical protein
VVGQELGTIHRRLEQGDEQLGELGEERVIQRVTLVSAVADLKDYIRANCVGSEDLKRLESRLTALENRMGELARIL